MSATLAVIIVSVAACAGFVLGRLRARRDAAAPTEGSPDAPVDLVGDLRRGGAL
jgi:hypothetical protein